MNKKDLHTLDTSLSFLEGWTMACHFEPPSITNGLFAQLEVMREILDKEIDND